MKKVVISLLLICAFNLHAHQMGALAKMDKMLSHAARAQKLAALPYAPVRPSNFPVPTQYNQQFVQMERLVQRQIILKNKDRLDLVNHENEKIANQQYQQVMRNFLLFKTWQNISNKNMD